MSAFTCLLTLISLFVGNCFSLSDANNDQIAFLSELYDLTSGSMWANNENWTVINDNTNVCDWYGVSCSGKWVQKLELKSNGLGGPLPDKWERLPYLESIDLSSNKILGSLPPSIGNLKLNNLVLTKNSLRGTIPDTLGNLGVRSLYLDSNQFSGTLPASLAKNPLVELAIDYNKLTGTIPSIYGDIGSQFLILSASFNDFTGVLPAGICKANVCNFEYNYHLGCPNTPCEYCYLPLCNCGTVCSTSTDCADGSCPTCSANAWGVTTCGGK